MKCYLGLVCVVLLEKSAARGGEGSVLTDSISVFVSYRREDTRHVAGRLGDLLQERFGHVFMDIDNIEPGIDFTEVIRRAVSECDVLLAIIGTQWTSLLDEQGERRLDNPHDWIVEEIRVALQRDDVRVVPVLVDGAPMPRRSELPVELAPLATRQALTLRYESFKSDAARLVAAIERMRAPGPPTVDGDPQYTAALAASSAEQWDEAVGHLNVLLQRHPKNPEIMERLAKARQQQQLVEWDARAAHAVREGNWEEAADALEQITLVQPGYRDATARLAVARARQRAADLEANEGGTPLSQRHEGDRPSYGGELPAPPPLPTRQPPMVWYSPTPAPTKSSSGPSFDLKSIGLPDWLMLNGSLLVFILSFFDVAGTDIDFFAEQSCAGLPSEIQPACVADIQAYGVAFNAWAFGLLRFGIILLFLVAVAIAAKAFKLIPANFPLHFVIAGIVVLVDIFFLIDFLDLLTTDGVAVGIGGWLMLAALIAVNVGVVMSCLAAGGKKALQGGLTKRQQNAAPGGGTQQGYGQQPSGGYGQPWQTSQQPQAGYGQSGQAPVGGYGQPGQQAPSGYGQPGQQAPR